MDEAKESKRQWIRGQGSNIFWGGLSLFFAAAACYFFFANAENELAARQLREQESLHIQQRDHLKAQVEKLQLSMADVNTLLKNREEKLKEQEQSLAGLTAEMVEAQNILKKQSQAQLQARQSMKQAMEVFKGVETITSVEKNKMLVLRIENSVLFLPGKFELSKKAKNLLEKFGKAIAPHLEENELRLEAFTDSDPILGTTAERYPSNLELSAARAAVVARFLTEKVELPSERILVVARGEVFPVVANTTPENKAKNRRLEILLEYVIPWVEEEESKETGEASSSKSALTN